MKGEREGEGKDAKEKGRDRKEEKIESVKRRNEETGRKEKI